jgi:hypothetical protein
LDWVSVVVVVTGAGTVVCDEVVVVLCVGSLAQADKEMTAAAKRQGMMNFFMVSILIWIVWGQSIVGRPSVSGYGVMAPVRP